MLEFLAQQWHKILIAFLSIGKTIEWGLQAWEKFKPVEEFIERRYHERRHSMFNPLTALVILGEIEKSLPALQQALKDVNQAIADKNNATAEFQDVAKILSDVQSLITAFGVPPASPTPVAPPPAI